MNAPCIAPGLCALLILAAVPANAQTTATASSAADTATTATPVATTTTPAATTAPAEPPPLYLDPSLPAAVRAEDLVARMTLAEKVSQMVHEAPAIKRLGVPAYGWWNECLHGVAITSATVFPQSIGLGATWNPELVGEMARAISDEARAHHHKAVREGVKNQHPGLTYWSPNINIFRDPRWGRGQETYGEDPYLTSRLGVPFVKGLQGDDPRYLKLVSTPKHYAVHSGPDPLRHRFNAKATQRDMWQTYFPAFEACVTEGGAWSVMGAYNRVNGVPACANPFLLQEVLRDKWHFPGYVVSDCGAIGNIYRDHKVVETAEEASAIAVSAGCDLECGEAYPALVKAVAQGLVSESVITRAVTRLMEARIRLGMFDPSSRVPYAAIPESVIDSPEHRALALRAARESIVLLKNERAFLPLKKDIGTIAVIGPNADDAYVMYGNYNGIPNHAVTPLAGIRAKVSSATKVLYAKGCEHDGMQPFSLLPGECLRAGAGKSAKRGLRGEYFNGKAFTGKPALSRVDAGLDFDWSDGAPGEGVGKDAFVVRWTGVIVPPKTGEYVLRLTTDDGVRLWVDGRKLFDDWSEHPARATQAVVKLVKGRAHKVRIEYQEIWGKASARLEWAPPVDAPFDDALAAARKADVVVMVLGLNSSLENEMLDRRELELPSAQRRLLSAVLRTGKPVVLVLENGSPVAFNADDKRLRAVVEAWYPGQEGGTAIADVLFGDHNPGACLPVTFPKSLKDVPDFENYAMKGRTYRFSRSEPLFPFGFGMSYTSFAYSDIAVTPNKADTGATVTVAVTVTNTGKREGDDVVQLYVSHRGAEGVPLRELQGFRRVHLKAGESQRVEFMLAGKQLCTVGADGKRAVLPGRIAVTAGGGQSPRATGAGAYQRTAFMLKGESRKLD